MPDLLKVRFVRRRDFKQILAIESLAFEDPWDRQDFVNTFAVGGNGLVVLLGSQLAGFLIYQAKGREILILNLAVHPDRREVGLGRALLDKLLKMAQKDSRVREYLVCNLPERNVLGQLFLQACGFKAIRVLPNYYEDCPDAAYRMVRAVGQVPAALAQRGRGLLR